MPTLGDGQQDIGGVNGTSRYRPRSVYVSTNVTIGGTALSPAASSGLVRVANGATVIAGLNAAGTTDRAILTWSTGDQCQIGDSAATVIVSAGNLGFYGASSGVSRQTVSGSRGSNAALASLLTALASYNLIVDSSS